VFHSIDQRHLVLEAIPVIFIGRHGLTVSQDGLIFLGVSIGTTIGAVSTMYIRGDENKRLVKEWRGFPPPEQRLYPATIGAPLLVIGSFWLGWTGAYSSVPWYVPAIGTIIIGAAISLIFLSCLVCSYYATFIHVLISTCTLDLSRGRVPVSLYG
jgi:MFS transporter, DHA1 family, multidrug resistance protein